MDEVAVGRFIKSSTFVLRDSFQTFENKFQILSIQAQ